MDSETYYIDNLVQDSEGHELVIDKDGEPMGVAEYRACGGSKILMDDYNAHRGSTMAAKGNVTCCILTEVRKNVGQIYL